MNSTRPFAHRSAFLLNANARAVSPRLAERMAEVVPQGDLFFSRTLDEAEIFTRTIARRGYGQVFTGGGDGTLVHAVNLLKRATTEEGLEMPKVGVLKLGTGNAMAKAVGAARPLLDAHHIVRAGAVSSMAMEMIEAEDGSLTPFAGMGYDGAILNDYVWLKKRASTPFTKHIAESVLGYLAAVAVRTVPTQMVKSAPFMRITSASDGVRMVGTPNGDVEEHVPAGSVLFEGQAPVVCVGTIPYYGFGFTMFPHARRHAGMLQLRVSTLPIPTILANLFPAVWRGTYRHEKLQDFLVRDVVIEADQPMPYQLGGDARGERQRLAFKVHEKPLEMLSLGKRLLPEGRRLPQLGPAFGFKLPK
jgi:diacylglycerol kinase family enzyme